jgi:tRNA A37 methylthiotransferase MiaB
MPQLPRKTINRRSRAINDLVEELSERHNAAWEGWEGEALVDLQKREGSVIARNFAYKPIILPDALPEELGGGPLPLGESIRVCIDGHTIYHLDGVATAIEPQPAKRS